MRTFSASVLCAMMPLAVAHAQDGAAPAGEAAAKPTFTAAERDIQKRLDDSVKELSEFRESTAAEKIPLNREISNLEQALVKARQKYQSTTNLLATRSLDLTKLTSEIKSREEEVAYLTNLLGEYLRNFESGLHIAELQRMRQEIQATRDATENEDLAAKARFDVQARMLATSIERLHEAFNGTKFEGTAVDAEGKVLYVWFDAPIGYISATKQWALENGKDWESYWKGGDEVELIHFIGKDNIVFHCIVFPAMLKAHGDFVLPINVPANQFLNFEGQKFSKSRGWGLEQHEYLQEFVDFPNKEDALRYALLRTLPENKDSDFKWDEFVDFHDKDLADNLGNFLNRVMVLSHSYFNGVVPPAPSHWSEPLHRVFDIVDQWKTEMEKFSFKAASQSFMDLSSWGNTYLQENAPWSLFKANPTDPRIAEIMFTGLQVSAILSIMAEPFIPFTSKRINAMLGLSSLPAESLRLFLNESIKQPFIATGSLLGAPEVLFPKIIDRKDTSRLTIIEKQKAKLHAIMEEEKDTSYPPLKPNITFDDFAKLDLRSGIILEAAAVLKADKLLVLKVDLGFEIRTIVSGIALHFSPESLIGKKVVVVANLEPRKLRGIESQGMLLLAERGTGELVFVGADHPMEGGWVVK
jgi:methionyl-tRNA synthetase